MAEVVFQGRADIPENDDFGRRCLAQNKNYEIVNKARNFLGRVKNINHTKLDMSINLGADPEIFYHNSEETETADTQKSPKICSSKIY